MKKYEEMETFELKKELEILEAEKELYSAIITNRKEEIRLLGTLIGAVAMTEDFEDVYSLASLGKKKQDEIESYEIDLEKSKNAWSEIAKELERRG